MKKAEVDGKRSAYIDWCLHFLLGNTILRKRVLRISNLLLSYICMFVLLPKYVMIFTRRLQMKQKKTPECEVLLLLFKVRMKTEVSNEG